MIHIMNMYPLVNQHAMSGRPNLLPNTFPLLLDVKMPDGIRPLSLDIRIFAFAGINATMPHLYLEKLHKCEIE